MLCARCFAVALVACDVLLEGLLNLLILLHEAVEHRLHVRLLLLLLQLLLVLHLLLQLHHHCSELSLLLPALLLLSTSLQLPLLLDLHLPLLLHLLHLPLLLHLLHLPLLHLHPLIVLLVAAITESLLLLPMLLLWSRLRPALLLHLL